VWTYGVVGEHSLLHAIELILVFYIGFCECIMLFVMRHLKLVVLKASGWNFIELCVLM